MEENMSVKKAHQNLCELASWREYFFHHAKAQGRKEIMEFSMEENMSVKKAHQNLCDLASWREYFFHHVKVQRRKEILEFIL
jgi:hypothetical protein